MDNQKYDGYEKDLKKKISFFYKRNIFNKPIIFFKNKKWDSQSKFRGFLSFLFFQKKKIFWN